MKKEKDFRRVLDRIWVVAAMVQMVVTIKRIVTDDYDD